MNRIDMDTILKLSTILTILKCKEKFISSTVKIAMTSAKRIAHFRNNDWENRKTIFLYIDSEVECSMPVSQAVIIVKERINFKPHSEWKLQLQNLIANRSWCYHFETKTISVTYRLL